MVVPRGLARRFPALARRDRVAARAVLDHAARDRVRGQVRAPARLLGLQAAGRADARATVSVVALRPYFAAMLRDDAPADGKTETSAGRRFPAGVTVAKESIKDSRLVGFADATSGVFNFKKPSSFLEPWTRLSKFGTGKPASVIALSTIPWAMS